MTVQDLLRHTSGLVYGTRGNSLVNKAYIEAKIGDRAVNNEEFAKQVAKMPLRFSPGTRWEYGVSTDILGRIVEVVTQKSLGVALEEMIFKPLGMVDTAFVVPPEKLNRAAQAAVSHKDRPMTPRFDVGAKAAFESGGGGLVGSTDDYLRFMLMLANGGTFNGKRLLGAQTMEFMAADHIGAAPGRPAGLGFGLGFEVRRAPAMAALPGSRGEYGWAGNAGTLFWIDPKRKLMALYMVQVNDYDRVLLRNQFRTMVQAAIIKYARARGIADVRSIMYHAGNRELQDAFDSRRIADRLGETSPAPNSPPTTAPSSKARSTSSSPPPTPRAGRTARSRAGPPGFVRVSGLRELAFPDYDGNGMFKSLGNLLVNANVGCCSSICTSGRAACASTAPRRRRREDPLLAEWSARR